MKTALVFGQTYQMDRRLVQRTTQIASLAFLAVPTFLLLFTTRSVQQLRDSLVYAHSAKTGVEMFHSHHILYTPAIHLTMQAIAPICPSCDAVFAGQLHNILWATVGILAIFLVARQVTTSLLSAGGVAAALLLVRGYWELATQTTMYVTSAAILALLAALLLVRSARQISLRRQTIIVFFFVLAILYHQANVLFGLPLGIYLVSSEGKRGWRIWLTVMATAGALVLGVYVWVFLSVHGSWSLSEFLRFCLRYTSEICLGGECKASPTDWGTSGNLSLTGVRSLAQSLLWNVVVVPSALITVLAPLYGLSIVGLCAWSLAQIVRRAPQRIMRSFLLAWLTIYTFFFLWWLPTYEHPFVVVTVPLLLLALLAYTDLIGWLRKWGAGRRVTLIGMASLLALLCGRNFTTTIHPLQAKVGDSWEEAASLVSVTDEDCTILTSYRVWNHLRYYFDRDVSTIQAKHPLSYFYLNQTLPDEYRLSDDACIVVATSYMVPDYTLTDYVRSGTNGYSNPTAWLAYVDWLSGLEGVDSSGPPTTRSVRAVAFAEGEPYFVFSAPARAVADRDALFQLLDQEMSLVSGRPARPFQTWAATMGRRAQ